MKKKIYFTEDVEFHSNDLELGPTGNKTINLYTVENGEVKKMADIECQLGDAAKTEIQNYLDDNGYEDETFEFVVL